MLDIETMGTDFERDDVIQIALLELEPTQGGTYKPGRHFSRTLHTAQLPKSDYIAKMHADLIKTCRRKKPSTPSLVREEILSFFKRCGVHGPAMIMGLNATTFDVPYLVHTGYLKKPTQNADNVLIGDYHYRIYELKGAYNLTKDVLGIDDKTLFDLAARADVDVELPDGKAHEALFDCYRQTKVLNGCIRLLRNVQSVRNG